jgi:rhodanese-related sulfurtransferase
MQPAHPNKLCSSGTGPLRTRSESANLPPGAGGAQLVEVLPADEYEEDHLPGAISLPLRRLETEAVRILDRTRPVIVYSWDTA